MAKVATKRAPAKKSASKRPVKARAAKKRVAVKASTNTVDYYPNRMTVAVSALAGTILVLVAVIAVLGSKG